MSAQMSAVNLVLRTVVRPVVEQANITPVRISAARYLLNRFASLIPTPKHIKIERHSFEKFYGEWIYLPQEKELCDEQVILYLHGGAYLVGSPATHREITGRLAHHTKSRVFAINYRKYPKYPYPCALDDSLHAYEWLLEQGVKPQNIVFAGDSAGGNLTLATLLAVRDRKLPRPAAAVCISPWADLSAQGDTIYYKRNSDPMIPAHKICQAAELHADGMDLEDPKLSPVYADLSGLPPLLIHVGDKEVLLSDSLRLTENAKAYGVDVELKVWPNAPHIFQIFAKLVPQSRQSLREIAQFIDQSFAA